jgi:membrane-associated phospholipid phosphatase
LVRRELVIGTGLLALATLGALLFHIRPSPTPLDVVGFALLPFNYQSGWAHDVTHIGSLPALVIGVVLLFAAGLPRDWRRAIACASAPVVAVLLVEEIAKPLVDRHVNIYGGPSYPSGTVAAAAALATAAVLVAPRVLKVPTALLGTAVVAASCIAVVVLRYHFPTDALGGICTGAGTVLLVDGLLQLSPARSLRGRPERQLPT